MLSGSLLQQEEQHNEKKSGVEFSHQGCLAFIQTTRVEILGMNVKL